MNALTKVHYENIKKNIVEYKIVKIAHKVYKWGFSNNKKDIFTFSDDPQVQTTLKEH